MHIKNTCAIDKTSFFKYLNKKLQSKDNISPLKSHNDNNIICNAFEKAECISHQFKSFVNLSSVSILPTLNNTYSIVNKFDIPNLI